MNPAKQMFVALGGLLVLGHCIASAEGLASAEDLNKLELGTHDLAEMKTLKGVTVVFDSTKIIVVFTLPRSSGGGTTNIIGLAGGPWRSTTQPGISRNAWRARNLRKGKCRRHAINALRRQNKSRREFSRRVGVDERPERLYVECQKSHLSQRIAWSESYFFCLGLVASVADADRKHPQASGQTLVGPLRDSAGRGAL